jgi:hypothetical protein
LASAAHLAGGEALSGLVVLLCVPAVTIVINLLTARQRGVGSLLVAMGLTQLGLHLAFMAASVTQSCQATGPHQMVSMPSGSGPTGGYAMQCGPAMMHDPTSAGLWPSPPMLLAHALAGVLVVLVLAYGERAVWALAACLRFRLVRPGPVVAGPTVVGRLPVPDVAAVRPHSAVHRRTVRRRGPPLATCAVP